MRTATVTKIKRTFDSDTTEHVCIIYIIKLTLDECKTLTKISTRNLSQQFPQTSAHFGHDKIRDKKTGKKHLALIPGKALCMTLFGKYEFLQVPFGLAQAPAFFQHLMNKVLDNCPFVMMYLDDIIIFSDTEEEYLAHIEESFKRLEAADLKMKRSKCDFFKKHIHYLGRLISADSI